MPYHIVPIQKGYKVKKVGENTYYSKHPMTLDKAKAQLRVLEAAYKSKK